MPVYQLPLPKKDRATLELHLSSLSGMVTLFLDGERVPRNLFSGQVEVEGQKDTYTVVVRSSPGRVYPPVEIDGEAIRYTSAAPQSHNILLTAAFVALFPGILLGGVIGFGVAMLSYVATRWILTEDRIPGFTTIQATVLVSVTYLTVLGVGVLRAFSVPVS